jgi:hypothetical protein
MFHEDSESDAGAIWTDPDGSFHWQPPVGYRPPANVIILRVFHFLGSWLLVESHRDCNCSYCGPLPVNWSPCCNPMGKEGLKLGFTFSESKSWNSWIIFHWRWRGARWYFRFTRGKLFSRKVRDETNRSDYD